VLRPKIGTATGSTARVPKSGTGCADANLSEFASTPFALLTAVTMTAKGRHGKSPWMIERPKPISEPQH
jgi:hypothetical protein